MTNAIPSTNQPKRVLSLDGGGIRGCLSLGYLAEIEAIVRKQLNNDKVVLSDYFDLIGGTSTGALIATMLAMGKEVKDVRDVYKSVGANVFSLPKYYIDKFPLVLRVRYRMFNIKRSSGLSGRASRWKKKSKE